MAESIWRQKIGWPKYHALAIANVRWLDNEMIWASQTSRKVFSYEWMDDSPEEDIRKAAGERLEENEDRFWFTQVPNAAMKDRIRKKLGW